MNNSGEKILNAPNFLTFLRPVAGVIFAIFLFSGYPKIILFYIFLLGSITDFFDGLLARKLNQTTKFGQLFDIVADRTFFSLVFISLIIYSVKSNAFSYFSYNLFLAVILLIPREILGFTGIFIASLRKKYIFIPPGFVNKLTGFMQYITLIFIILNLKISFYSAIITFIIGFIAGTNYIIKSWKQKL